MSEESVPLTINIKDDEVNNEEEEEENAEYTETQALLTTNEKAEAEELPVLSLTESKDLEARFNEHKKHKHETTKVIIHNDKSTIIDDEEDEEVDELQLLPISSTLLPATTASSILAQSSVVASFSNKITDEAIKAHTVADSDSLSKQRNKPLNPYIQFELQDALSALLEMITNEKLGLGALKDERERLDDDILILIKRYRKYQHYLRAMKNKNQEDGLINIQFNLGENNNNTKNANSKQEHRNRSTSTKPKKGVTPSTTSTNNNNNNNNDNNNINNSNSEPPNSPNKNSNTDNETTTANTTPKQKVKKVESWQIDVARSSAKIVDNLILLRTLKFKMMRNKRSELERMLSKFQSSPLLSSSRASSNFRKSKNTIYANTNAGSIRESSIIEKLQKCIEEDKTIKLLEKKNAKLKEEISRIKRIHGIADDSQQKAQANQQSAEINALTDKIKALYKPYGLVDQLIRDQTSKEAYNISHYVDQFLKAGPNDPPPPHPWKMISKLSESITKKFNVSERQAETSLEEYIFPQIYNKLMDSFDLQADDLHLLNQCKKFSSVTQEQLSIAPQFIDKSFLPYVEAIAELRTIYFAFSPIKKLYAILGAAKCVYDNTSRIAPNEKGLRNLASTVAFLREYTSSDVIQAELGYYFSALELATNYIRGLTEEKLHSNPSAMITDRPILICEYEKYKRFAEANTNFVLSDEPAVITGFKAYVVEEWLVDVSKFYSVILHKTGNENDRVTVYILRATENISASQQSYIAELFFKPKDNIVVAEEASVGTVLIAKTFPPANLTLHPLENGNFAECIVNITARINFTKMGYNPSPTTPMLDIATKEEIKTMYKLSYKVGFNETKYNELTIAERVVELVKRVQLCLKHLHFFPWLGICNGLLSVMTTLAISRFQQHYNQYVSQAYQGHSGGADIYSLFGDKQLTLARELPEDGKLTVDTWKCIHHRVYTFHTIFHKLGFEIFEPIDEYEQFSQVIKDFQTTHSVMPDGGIGIKTVKILVVMLREKGFTELEELF